VKALIVTLLTLPFEVIARTIVTATTSYSPIVT
jgi:hypothetical protein